MTTGPRPARGVSDGEGAILTSSGGWRAGVVVSEHPFGDRTVEGAIVVSWKASPVACFRAATWPMNRIMGTEITAPRCDRQ